METKTYATHKAILDNIVIAEGKDAVDLRNLDPNALSFYSMMLYNRAQITFQRVTVQLTIEQKPEFRYGFTGQLRDVVVAKTEDVQSEEVLIYSVRKGTSKWK